MSGPTPPRSVNATFCAALVDEWLRCGLGHAVVAPGSRSTPIALALASRDEVRTHVVLDERSAGFVALGLGLATGRPALVVTTSGTAAAELHPAVVEAFQAGAPLIACTADRPPELHGVGAPQTIDQVHLYGRAVRWYGQPGPPAEEAAHTWRSFAARAWLEAVGTGVAGPVQLDLAFREPLVGSPGPLPHGRPDGGPWHARVAAPATLPSELADALAASWWGRTGVILAGAGVDRPDLVLALGRRLGWPVLADPRSGCRVPGTGVVAHADAILRSPIAAAQLAPDVVLQLGSLPASKVVCQWVASSGAERVVVGSAGAHLDPDGLASSTISAEPGSVCGQVAAALDRAVGPGAPPPEAAHTASGRWRAVEAASAAAIDASLSGAGTIEASEVGAARAVVAAGQPDDLLVVSSSMPVRDVEWYGAPRRGLRVLANRGANGIDGVLSTAVGAALGRQRTWLLIGDLALLHDATGLMGVAARSVQLRVVVIDNGGGGIFSFLPQASALPAPLFERYFGTPPDLGPATLLRAHGVPTEEVSSAAGTAGGLDRLARHEGPVAALVVYTDRARNVEQHAAVNQAVALAVEVCLTGR